ncbi:MAG: hypothetical protein AB7S56_08720 [Halothiobacillaceae bacterium]
MLALGASISASQAHILLDTADRPARLGYGTTCSQMTSKGTFTSDCGAMKYTRYVRVICFGLLKSAVCVKEGNDTGRKSGT